MPELPEVETIIRQLQDKILNKTISKIEILDPAVVHHSVAQAVNLKIIKVYRRAKMLVFELNDNSSLLTSLRMTGHFRYQESKKAYNQQNYPFIVGKFHFSDGSVLSHHSIRKFGFIKLLNKQELAQEFTTLGIEPLAEEFSVQKFKELLMKKEKTNIKSFLMDQSQVVGIGNIYAQETLYHAGIDPRNKIAEIPLKKQERLYTEIKRVLALAITKKGTTVENYSNLEGMGNFQEELAVYDREKCPKNHLITKIVLGGRGTSFCSECQK